jgi:hypothetical protein
MVWLTLLWPLSQSDVCSQAEPKLSSTTKMGAMLTGSLGPESISLLSEHFWLKQTFGNLPLVGDAQGLRVEDYRGADSTGPSLETDKSRF